MADVIIYTTARCGYCVRAKNLLGQLEIPFDERRLDDDWDLREKLSNQYNWRTVPMIFIRDRFIGGYDDLNALHRAGRLQALLQGEANAPEA